MYIRRSGNANGGDKKRARTAVQVEVEEEEETKASASKAVVLGVEYIGEGRGFDFAYGPVPRGTPFWTQCMNMLDHASVQLLASTSTSIRRHIKCRLGRLGRHIWWHPDGQPPALDQDDIVVIRSRRAWGSRRTLRKFASFVNAQRRGPQKKTVIFGTAVNMTNTSLRAALLPYLDPDVRVVFVGCSLSACTEGSDSVSVSVPDSSGVLDLVRCRYAAPPHSAFSKFDVDGSDSDSGSDSGSDSDSDSDSGSDSDEEV